MSKIFKRSHNNATCKLSFLLLDNFSLIAFSSMIEGLRLANWISQKNLYSWELISRDGQPVESSAGTPIQCHKAIPDAKYPENIIVCSGIDVHCSINNSILGWIRRWARQGCYIGAICTGTYVLAKAGLLAGYKCTIHWANIESFLEDFPDIHANTALFQSDNDRFTCAGGIASLDMTLQDITENYGSKLAAQVSDQIIIGNQRTQNDTQRLPPQVRLGINHPKLINAITQMENNTEEPLSRFSIAENSRLSKRQLERLFRQYLHTSPAKHYLKLRLKRAESLLSQTSMPITEIAFACGFTSTSHFSKCYRNNFGYTPREQRQKITEAFKINKNITNHLDNSKLNQKT